MISDINLPASQIFDISCLFMTNQNWKDFFVS